MTNTSVIKLGNGFCCD